MQNDRRVNAPPLVGAVIVSVWVAYIWMEAAQILELSEQTQAIGMLACFVICVIAERHFRKS